MRKNSLECSFNNSFQTFCKDVGPFELPTTDAPAPPQPPPYVPQAEHVDLDHEVFECDLVASKAVMSVPVLYLPLS